MKKLVKIVSLIMALCVIMAFSLTSFGAATEILKGTPEIDGKLDDIYTQSLTLILADGDEGNGFYSTSESGETATDTTGKVYLLWDDKYLYICADMKDGDVLSAGDDYINSEDNPWMNDATEHWVDLNTGESIKVSVDAFAKRVFGNAADEFDFASVIKAATQGNGGYVTEVAIPFPVAIAEGSEIGYKLQVNDLAADGSVTAIAADYDGEGPQGVVYYKLGKSVVLPEVKDEPAKEEAAPNKNPSTSDVNAFVYVLMSIASLGFIFTLKTLRKSENN